MIASARFGATAAVLLAGTAFLSFAGPEPKLLGQTLSEYALRRESLRKAAGKAVVLLIPPVEESDRYRFRADNNVVYLTGLEMPGCAVAVLPEGDPLNAPCAVFVPGGWQYPDAVEKARDRSNITQTYERSTLWDTLAPSLAQCGTVFIDGPVGERAKHTPTQAVIERVAAINPKASIRSASPLLAELRLRKSSGEVANLRAAIAATEAGFRRAAPTIRPGVTELAIEGEIIAGFRAAGAAREGFPPVIGAGPNAVSIHGDPTLRPMEKGETLVVDIGAEVSYYTADLTRTFPVGGKFSPRAEAIYELVRDVQQACARHVQAGKTTWSELDRFAREQFRGSNLRAADRGGQLQTMDQFYVHSIGHWLGMDVHDVGSMSAPMPVGSVITIEPGLYIASENIGIRIEDDFLVTETGARRLSDSLPSDIASIEKMMRGN